MYERTKGIVLPQLQAQPIPPADAEVHDTIASQIFGVVGSSELTAIWTFADSLVLWVVVVPGLLVLIFDWLAFRSRVRGVYLSILTQAMTLALSLWPFQNAGGLRGNNRLSALQNIPDHEHVPQSVISIAFFWASSLALGAGYLLFAWSVSDKMGSAIRGIRDDEARVRFLGYHVEAFGLFVFTLTAVVAGIAGASYYPQAGIINRAEVAPIAPIYLAVRVAIGGRGRLYGAAIGAAFVSLLSSWFTGGGAPDVTLGVYRIQWSDWWLVLLGLSFVLVALFAQAGIGALIHAFARRDGLGDLAPHMGALRKQETAE